MKKIRMKNDESARKPGRAILKLRKMTVSTLCPRVTIFLFTLVSTACALLVTLNLKTHAVHHESHIDA
jgi:hypothetical protein